VHYRRVALKGLWRQRGVFDELRDKWSQQIGPDELERVESHLATLVGVSTVRIDSPGWIAHSLDETT
jgi:hypothetical protein